MKITDSKSLKKDTSRAAKTRGDVAGRFTSHWKLGREQLTVQIISHSGKEDTRTPGRGKKLLQDKGGLIANVMLTAGPGEARDLAGGNGKREKK